MSESRIHVVDEVADGGNVVVPVATQTHGGKDYQEMVFGIVNAPHNEILPSYSGDLLTSVVYKLDGVTVCTVTIGYSGDKITSVVRS